MGDTLLRKLALTVSSLVALGSATGQTAQAQTKHLLRAPYYFAKQARCVHSHEAGAWKWTPQFHPGYNYWNGYWTGLQFDHGTWDRANKLLHMRTSSYTSSPRLVILHAYVIVKQDNGSWREWKHTAALCGLPTY